MNLAARYFCPSSRWNPLDSSDFPDLSSYLSSRLNSMSLNESIVEDAALEWFLLRQGSGGQVGALGTAVGHGPQLAPGEAAAERDSFGEGVLVGRLRAAIRRLNPVQAKGVWPCFVGLSALTLASRF